MKKLLVISGTVIATTLSLLTMAQAQQPAAKAPAKGSQDSALFKQVPVITQAGAQAMIDACTAWSVAKGGGGGSAMVVIDSGGGIIVARGTVGVPNNLDTALLKAKDALRWRRPSSDTNASLKGGRFSPPQFVPGDFPIGGGLPIAINGDVIGAMGTAMGGNGEPCIQAAMDKVFGGMANAYGTGRKPLAPAAPGAAGAAKPED